MAAVLGGPFPNCRIFRRELTQLTLRQLDELARRHVIEPSGLAARGKGSRRVYTRTDVILLKGAALLRQVGIVGPPFIQALEEIRKATGEDSAVERVLVISPAGVTVRSAKALTNGLPMLKTCSVVLPFRALSLPETGRAVSRRKGSGTGRRATR